MFSFAGSKNPYLPNVSAWKHGSPVLELLYISVPASPAILPSAISSLITNISHRHALYAFSIMGSGKSNTGAFLIIFLHSFSPCSYRAFQFVFNITSISSLYFLLGRISILSRVSFALSVYAYVTDSLLEGTVSVRLASIITILSEASLNMGFTTLYSQSKSAHLVLIVLSNTHASINIFLSLPVVLVTDILITSPSLVATHCTVRFAPSAFALYNSDGIYPSILSQEKASMATSLHFAIILTFQSRRTLLYAPKGLCVVSLSLHSMDKESFVQSYSVLLLELGRHTHIL